MSKIKSKLRQYWYVALISAIALAGAAVTDLVLQPPSQNQSPQNQCEGNAQTQQCWQEKIDKVLQDKGLDDAFALVSELYASEPHFASDCHQYLHVLGEQAYEIFISGNKVKLPPAVTFCGYGFYHGLMQALLATEDFVQAREFCNQVTETSPPVISSACYHGVGHGALELAARDPQLWVKAEAMIDEALAICLSVADSQDNSAKCSSGVFMQYAVYAIGGEYGQSINIQNPFSICETQSEAHKPYCYSQFQTVINRITANNIALGAKYLEQITEDHVAESAMQSLVGAAVDIKKPDLTLYLTDCRAVAKRLREFCLSGIVLAFMLKGVPGQEYVGASNFCNNAALTAEERDICFISVRGFIETTYPPEKIEEICKQSPIICPRL